ncbi:MAG: hypothetical protein U1E58_07265 [Tabrizicola sp.]
MTTLTIPAGDRHGVRVFSARLSAEELQRDKADLLARLLGDKDLDPAFIELFDVADLAGLGLAAYLADGMGAAEASLAADQPRLDAVTGPVLILLSKALHGREVTLTPDPRLTLIGTYAEDRPPVHFQPLPSSAAEGTLTPDLPPDRTPQRPMLAFLLLGVALALVALVAVWLAVT